MQNSRIYLSPPHMNGREMQFIQQAFDSNWIAPLGQNVAGLESDMKRYLGIRGAVALSAGTAAIHMGLKYLRVGPGDKVFCADSTFSASCNPILYLGAEPVFIDSDMESWNMSPKALAAALADARANGSIPKAVIVVDLYGLPAKYDEILPLCKEYGVPVLEDAAEALGSRYRGKPCATFGDCGVISFNANKIITTACGGMLVSGDTACTDKALFWATQSKEAAPYYLHNEVGYNYRLSNISAGIGRGQMETLEDYVEKRRHLNRYYREQLAGYPVTFAPEIDGARPNCWLTVMLLEANENVLALIDLLREHDIESRCFWNPMHRQPVFSGSPFYRHNRDGSSVSSWLFKHGICLPSGSAIDEPSLDRVIAIIKQYYDDRADKGAPG